MLTASSCQAEVQRAPCRGGERGARAGWKPCEPQFGRSLAMRGDKAGSATVTNGQDPSAAEQALGVTDRRTGVANELPITDSTIRAIDLRQFKVADDDFGLLSYDPGFVNTVPCRSAITFIDGDVGILEYRGYPIEQLAVQSSFLEVDYLLLNGELPSPAEL